MPKPSEQILAEIRELKSWLYGDDGKEGDIPEIKKHLEKINGHLDDHSYRLVIAETQIKERTASKISKKAIAGYSSGGLLVLAITILRIIQMLSG